MSRTNLQISKKVTQYATISKFNTRREQSIRAAPANDWIHATVMKVLSSRGYRLVRPEASRVSVRAPFISYVAMNDNYETLCIKVKKPDAVPGRAMSVISLCEREIPLMRSLLMEIWGDTYLRCEIWIFTRSREMACIEVTQDGLCLLPELSIRLPLLLRTVDMSCAGTAGFIAGESPSLKGVR
jgi:hypothetical protein